MLKLPPYRIAACCALLALTPLIQAERAIDTLKDNTERWIEIRNRLANEEAEWQSNKEILKTSVETLKSTKEAFQQSLAFHRKSIESLKTKLAEAQTKESDFQATNEALAKQIALYEARIQSLSSQLPDPLSEKIAGLLAKIPSSRDDTRSPLPNRLQNVIAIMTTIDEFNRSLTLSHAIKTLESGEVIDVRILYFGLATGFAIDAAGAKAWILKPGASGWIWIRYDENAAAVKEAFEVFDKKKDPKVVQLPFQLAAKEASE